MRNFIHLFIHYVLTCRYQQHLIVRYCLKIIGDAGMPPSDYMYSTAAYCTMLTNWCILTPIDSYEQERHYYLADICVCAL